LEQSEFPTFRDVHVFSREARFSTERLADRARSVIVTQSTETSLILAPTESTTMYQNVKQWQDIRHRVLKTGTSRRSILRETGMSWKTLKKILEFPLPQPYARREGVRGKPPSPSRRPNQIWCDVLNSLATAKASNARTIISAISAINPNQANGQRLVELRQQLAQLGFGREAHIPDQDARDHVWLRHVMQGALSTNDLRDHVGDVECLDQLLGMAQAGLRDRSRAISVIARMKGISLRSTARFLCLSSTTVLRYQNRYRKDGVQGLADTYRRTRLRKAQRGDVRNAVFSILHTPPREHGLNRTSWKIEDLKVCLSVAGHHLCRGTIREVIRSAGYKWRKAKVVLTSPDPEYREKLQHIQTILASLHNDERFFSIDEFGPFSIKMKGGRRLVAPDEFPYVPQIQKSKGYLIVTSALELSTNQVTHFFSRKKNTVEMLRLLYLLLQRYRGCRKLYLSWDAASWHSSKRLYRHVNRVNSAEYRRQRDTPEVELAPLPASAQFLNVIESVFSGMARAIIHNSDYGSVAETMCAIDEYFSVRNEDYRLNPKRAGNRIWGKELVPPEFDQAHNCKDPRW
jgi:transposase